MSNDYNTIKIAFFADVVGKPGRFALRDFLTKNSSQYDLVIANIENASHGFGLTEKNYNDFIEYGVDAMTCGNHIWDKKDIHEYIEKADRLIRPINYPYGTPGVGSRIIETKDGVKIGIINALGQVFMSIIDSPWKIIENEIKNIKQITPIVILDFHAEATAEKVCLGRYCSELGLSAFFGTHTHIQTADESIINGMGYITDAGFCGAGDGVIGMDYHTSLSRFLSALPQKYEIAQGNTVIVNGVVVEIDKNSGQTVNIKRIYETMNKVEETTK